MTEYTGENEESFEDFFASALAFAFFSARTRPSSSVRRRSRSRSSARRRAFSSAFRRSCSRMIAR